ncbi:hypothetical protein L2E82_26723 [Cichorium intybus]|uniref:Uncharacterized protein n=1 Tax=Cichorium intybus TaxID=13427 RepID=A0ACB9CRD2_CICIN|nr:hypothetical protein L2E82_26723 [Cichorium intybus]
MPQSLTQNKHRYQYTNLIHTFTLFTADAHVSNYSKKLIYFFNTSTRWNYFVHIKLTYFSWGLGLKILPIRVSPDIPFNAEGVKSHGDKTFLSPPPELPVLDDVIMDPLDLGDPMEPVPTLVGRESGSVLLTPEFGPSHYNNGLSTSKRRRIDPSMHRLPRTSLSPRRLSGEFDLNVAIPILSSVSGTAIVTSPTTSKEVDQIVKIGNEVGFQFSEGNIDILVNNLGKDAQGEGEPNIF